MSVEKLCEFGVFELAQLYRRGELSPVEVVNAHLQRCARLNPVLNAYLLIMHDSAMQAARAAECLFQAEIDLGLLQGIPISVKDLIRVRGTRTTAGSRVLLQEPPDPEDAAVVQRLRAAGAVIIGKTNLHEFASGDPDPDGPFGLVQNPRAIGYHSGMSSSGAAAAVAAGLGVIGLGTDTGGSIRIPAYLCGVAGLKPTNGRIPLDGIIPLSWTLDTVGPLARRVRDVAAAFVGLESTERLQRETDFLNQLNESVRGWRIGIPVGDYFSRLQPVVTSAFKRTLKILEDFGCQLIEFTLPGIEEMAELSLIIIRGEASVYHEKYRDREHLYGLGFLKERIIPGRELRASTYLAACQQKIEFQKKWLEATRQIDVLIMPSGPALAPRHGVSKIEIEEESFPFRPVLSRFARPFNLVGWPALSVPNGVSVEGLPTGVQIICVPNGEFRLLILGHQVEQALGLTAKLDIEPKYPN